MVISVHQLPRFVSLSWCVCVSSLVSACRCLCICTEGGNIFTGKKEYTSVKELGLYFSDSQNELLSI